MCGIVRKASSILLSSGGTRSDFLLNLEMRLTLWTKDDFPKYLPPPEERKGFNWEEYMWYVGFAHGQFFSVVSALKAAYKCQVERFGNDPYGFYSSVHSFVTIRVRSEIGDFEYLLNYYTNVPKPVYLSFMTLRSTTTVNPLPHSIQIARQTGKILLPGIDTKTDVAAELDAWWKNLLKGP